jgi:hypothetical protein
LVECWLRCPPAGDVVSAFLGASTGQQGIVLFARPTAVANLLEQVDQAVNALGTGSYQPQASDQAVDVRLVQGNALHDLALHLSWIVAVRAMGLVDVQVRGLWTAAYCGVRRNAPAPAREAHRNNRLDPSGASG